MIVNFRIFVATVAPATIRYYQNDNLIYIYSMYENSVRILQATFHSEPKKEDVNIICFCHFPKSEDNYVQIYISNINHILELAFYGISKCIKVEFD